MAKSFKLVLRYCAKGIGALSRKPTLRATLFSRRSTALLERCVARSQLRSLSDSSVLRSARECTLANASSWATMSAASRSTPAHASWRNPSRERCSSPELSKIWCQVPELIFKIAAFTSSKGFPASGDSSGLARDSKMTEVKRWKKKSGLAIHREEFSQPFQSCSNSAWWPIRREVSRSYPGN
jgi:hypothetical protein